MKKTLLSAFLLAAVGMSAQTVNTFYTISANTYEYQLAESATLLDESASGENVTWNFSGLTAAGYSSTATIASTDGQEAEFPTTNTVVETSGDFTTTEFFLNNAQDGGTFLTAASSNGIMLDYAANNAFLGIFPKAYGAAAVADPISGSFTYVTEEDTYNGTFSGTCTTSVDGYGTLTTNVGTTPAGTPVTRLKIVQVLNIVYTGFPVGTVTQTMYSYYAAAPADAPVFRTLTMVMNLPLLGLNNETTQSIESYYDPLMATTNPFEVNKIAIAPNPVADVLHFTGNAQVTKVVVTDAAGRQVLQSAANDVNVSSLSAGIYYVTAQTSKGNTTLKIAKQ
ncbi:T9SS type A sorting domain-containing protein [Flavobacterium sp. RHBU_24]|uniref:T9SS type A sorting domain-containing protein n=1 Tax=Flavobacterium sp. RHBU_24 TaxID=3391185 RepID=UPI00398538D6